LLHNKRTVVSHSDSLISLIY